MKICKGLIFLLVLNIYAISYSFAVPRPKVKFGNVLPKDFDIRFYPIDTSASAVFLFDNGKAFFEGNNEGYLSVIYTRHARIHILTKNGFDAATVSFPTYSYSDFTNDKIKKFEAVVYNIENGKIIETKVDKESVFRDKVVKGVTINKFTFPNVKEGSIIEYRYTIEVPNPGGLRSWYFQEQYPRIWSELDLSIPDIYRYTPLMFSINKFDYDTVMFKTGTFSVIERGDSYSRSNVYTVTCGVTQFVWGIQNVPALKNEPFIISAKNFQPRIEFMYTAFAPDNNTPRPVMKNWFQISEALMKDSDFGLELDASNNFFQPELVRLKANDTSQLDIVKRVYYFVRDNFSCLDHSSIYLSQPIKKTYEERKGNVADINLLLIAMYRKLGFSAHPVILSTRSNARPIENYPLLRNFDYILCQLNVNDNYYVLDASIPDLGFNKLDLACYNDNGRIIASTPLIVKLPSDSMLAIKTTSVFVGKDEKDKMGASFSSTLSYEESRFLRRNLKTEKLTNLIGDIKKKYSMDVEIKNLKIDSLNLLDYPITIQYDIDFPWEDELIYFTPTLGEGYRENIFKAAERKYPIELESGFDEIYTLNLEIPNNYAIEEMPKSVRLNYEGNKSLFEYIITTNGKTIYFSMRLKFAVANFASEDYEQLRDYFAQIVKKQNEQIVFKKKK